MGGQEGLEWEKGGEWEERQTLYGGILCPISVHSKVSEQTHIRQTSNLRYASRHLTTTSCTVVHQTQLVLLLKKSITVVLHAADTQKFCAPVLLKNHSSCSQRQTTIVKSVRHKPNVIEEINTSFNFHKSKYGM